MTADPSLFPVALLITGSRSLASKAESRAWAQLLLKEVLLSLPNNSLLIHGGAVGPDKWAGEIFQTRANGSMRVYYADGRSEYRRTLDAPPLEERWSDRDVGPLARNTHMVVRVLPALTGFRRQVLGLVDMHSPTRGTDHTLNLARKQGFSVRRFVYPLYGAAMDLTKKRVFIFDADGTLRRCLDPKKPCPNAPGEWELMPNVREKLRSLDWAEVIGVVSNQAGVAFGHLTREVAQQMLADTFIEALSLCSVATHPKLKSTHLFMCAHHPDAACVCRKPEPFGLYSVMGALVTATGAPLSKSEVLYVGDMASDKKAASRAGVDFMWACDFFGWDTPCKGKEESDEWD